MTHVRGSAELKLKFGTRKLCGMIVTCVNIRTGAG